ncbi:hypothetical protein [Roseococcus sp. YIM B11640]|uniref:hypothetical protein n=1 Tax=Roseococcus sp. YIM B11640 TaxID=3133973 RepID=UPI003C7C0E65
MKQLALAGTFLACLAALPAGAQTPTQTLARAGWWTAFSGPFDGDTPACGIDNRDSQTGRQFQIIQRAGQPMLVRMVRPSWNITAYDRVPVRFAIDAGRSWSAEATGSGQEITWVVTGDVAPGFESAFRNGSSMRIEFLRGNEATWHFSLSGSNAIMNAFQGCVATLAPAQPPPVVPLQPGTAPAPLLRGKPLPATPPGLPPDKPVPGATPSGLEEAPLKPR